MKRRGKRKRRLRLSWLLTALALAAGLWLLRSRLPEILGLRTLQGSQLATELTLVPAGSIPNMGLEIPPYTGETVTVLADNQPGFGPDFPVYEGSYAHYSELDALGRSGAAMACIGLENMPLEPRPPMDESLRPVGYRNAVYEDLIEDRFLYNRCHILGYQLSGDAGDLHNLFTGTRELNVAGMLPYENRVAACLREQGGHVLYRVTPRYQDRELVPRDVELEAWSVEDHGKALCFHVFVHNVQPGIVIDYRTGESRRA